MYNDKKSYDCVCSSSCSMASGNSLDVSVNHCDCEVRADIVVSEFSSVRLWGRVVNCDGKPISNALVKLLKVVCSDNKVYYQGIAHTVTDCDGFYQFEVCSCDKDDDNACYKILVSKAAYGPERVIPRGEGNCNPCDEDNPCTFNPCNEYTQIMTPPGEVGTGAHCCDGETCSCNCNQHIPGNYSSSKKRY